MAPTKKLRADQLKAFDLAAAGHDGVLCDESGTLVVKPCTAREVAFYDTAKDSPLAPWMPLYYGTLQLNDPSADPTSDAPVTHNRHTSIVLQDLTAGFNKACVLDVKLGAQLWDEEAPQDKRDRLDKVSDATTSRSLGFRVAGMKVWKGEEGGYKDFDKLYGRTFTADTVIEAFKEYFSAPISAEEKTLVLKRFTEMVGQVKEVLEAHESKMYSASLLFVYEGDAAAIKEALEDEKTRKPKNEDEDEDEDDDEEEEVIKKVDELKLIDFAHASWTPGEGPDENALQGVRSVEKLLKELSFSA